MARGLGSAVLSHGSLQLQTEALSKSHVGKRSVALGNLLESVQNSLGQAVAGAVDVTCGRQRKVLAEVEVLVAEE